MRGRWPLSSEAGLPCWRCGAREVDPVRGPSPWKRAVRGGLHVLVCPDCQHDRDWTADLDHCPSCGSWRLVRQLGQVTCRACNTTINPDDELPPGPPRVSPSGASSGLSKEVSDALARLWNKSR